EDRDGLAADNVRYAVLDAASRPGILVVTSSGDRGRDGLYVHQALSAGSGPGRVYQPSAMAPAQLSAVDLSRRSSPAAVILLSTRGLERRGRETLAGYVRGGGGLLIAVGPDID